MSSIDSVPSTRPAKRARTDGHDMTDASFIHSPDVWMDDGNIVLQTTEGATHTMYKVHKSTLAHTSGFFRALFYGSKDALEAGSEHYEGVPVLAMPDDADDVREWLMAIYSFRPLHRLVTQTDHRIVSRFPDPFDSLLRIATKYECEALRESCVRLLMQEFPTKLEDWDDRERVALEMTHDEAWSDPMHIIRLATDCDVPDALPLAFYDAATLIELEGDNRRELELSLLTSADLVALIRGRSQLRSRFLRFVARSATDLNNEHRRNDICDLTSCEEVLEDLWTGFNPVTMADAERARDPLNFMKARAQKIYSSNSFKKSLCPLCQKWLRGVIHEFRQAMWASLPNAFGLDGRVSVEWDEPL
ncbi:hypothetical protein OF83DRAFT_1283765 [Amylostereum chailletii]|nr:hypothetical protein OF83DRAFT_1283765 [Amylostereum chailletii]